MEDTPAANTGQNARRAGVVGAIALIATTLYVGIASAQPAHTTVPSHDCAAPTATARRTPANINLLPRLGEAKLVAHHQVDMTKAPKAAVPPQRTPPQVRQPGNPTSPVTASADDAPRINASATTNPCTPNGAAAPPQAAP